MTFDLPAAQGVARAEGREGGVDEAVHQVFVAAMGNPQARGLDDLRGAFADIVDEQALRVETAGVPVRHLQAQGAAEQGLAGAQLARRAFAAVRRRVELAHAGQGGVAGDAVQPGVAGLDQVCRIIPVTPRLTGIKQCRV